ncbi:valine--pyruvate transaminase [Moraxella sp. VT-16-12]|uniref:valine--pyruvate transaminase n=1 Tax=Moraxella sp. VT-16-12 TaxID=2014877 RepID=UPI000B7D56C5|nr:valine--pyruvate transaminase [Moraxella sp. VT-16-12]TWV80828.1 valine--pyruvate transaminase [Moraxella sp. VT-16-12]
MQFSTFGQKFTRQSGILQLMDDLGQALASDKPVNMLGGGNPAMIPAVNEVYQATLEQLVADGTALNSVANYSTPQGDKAFVDSLVDFFNRHYDWGLTADNIALTNGSQNAFFYLFNLFSGDFGGTDKKILLPLAPEYIGYADAHVDGTHFVAVEPIIDECTHDGQAGFFKYRVDFERLKNLPTLQNGQIGAICVSRPTNPTGNVLTDDEMDKLSAIAQAHDIPLIIDNAYGMPFPNIIYTDTTLNFDDNTILCFSLSKVGLPSVRTGIIVANPAVIKAVLAMNAIINLAPTRFGASLAKPLFDNDEIIRLSQTAILPFYQRQSKLAVRLLKEQFANLPVYIHKPEGAMFLWVWFKDLPITSQELYERLKEQGTLIIPSRHFFVGIDTTQYCHAHECIRLSVAQSDEVLTAGIAMIGEVVRSVYE